MICPPTTKLYLKIIPFFCDIMGLRVQYSCGIMLVFWFWREIIFGVTYILCVQYSCAVVSVFWLRREIVLKMRTPFDFLWAVSSKKSYWVTLLWSTSWYVYVGTKMHKFPLPVMDMPVRLLGSVRVMAFFLESITRTVLNYRVLIHANYQF